MSAPMAHRWSAMPDDVAIRCPRCAGAATFISARYVYAPTHAERDRHAADSQVELVWITDRMGQRQAIAIHHPGLVTGPPPFQGTSMRFYPVGIDRNRGSFRCAVCYARGRHDLAWPGGALFSWDIRGRLLWAYTRAHAVALSAFIASVERDPAGHGDFEWFLGHVPSAFLDAKLREFVVRRIEATLAAE